MIRGNGGVCKPAWWVQPGWQHDGRVQSSGKEITDFLPEGGNFVTGASTRSVTEMTKSVDTDARFLKFGGLAGWSIAGVSRGKVKMSHWWNPKYCPCSPMKTVKASSSIPALSAQVITKLNLTHQNYKHLKFVEYVSRGQYWGVCRGQDISGGPPFGHKSNVCLKMKWQFNP